MHVPDKPAGHLTTQQQCAAAGCLGAVQRLQCCWGAACAWGHLLTAWQAMQALGWRDRRAHAPDTPAAQADPSFMRPAYRTSLAPSIHTSRQQRACACCRREAQPHLQPHQCRAGAGEAHLRRQLCGRGHSHAGQLPRHCRGKWPSDAALLDHGMRAGPSAHWL